MGKIDLIDNNWTDLVFEGKNKEYGAYVLRKETGKRNVKALIWVLIGIAALIVCVGATNIYNFMDGINGITAGYSLAVLVPLLHGFVLMLPILLGDFLHADGATFGNSIWVVAFAVELVLYAVGTVFLIFVLVSERTVAVHKVAASCDPLTGLLNRRGFAEATARMIEREARPPREPVYPA